MGDAVSECPHGVNIKNHRCEYCEREAQAEQRRERDEPASVSPASMLGEQKRRLDQAAVVIQKCTEQMDAVAKYLQPNWSNDMDWADEIIIAIDQRVANAAPILEDVAQKALEARWAAEAERDALKAKLDAVKVLIAQLDDKTP